MTEGPLIEVRGLTIRRDKTLIQHGLNFTVARGQIFAIMGETGAGKSALIRHMVGLEPPAEGEVFYQGVGFWSGSEESRERLMRRFGVLFAGGALFGGAGGVSTHWPLGDGLMIDYLVPRLAGLRGATADRPYAARSHCSSCSGCTGASRRRSPRAYWLEACRLAVSPP